MDNNSTKVLNLFNRILSNISPSWYQLFDARSTMAATVFQVYTYLYTHMYCNRQSESKFAKGHKVCAEISWSDILVHKQ